MMKYMNYKPGWWASYFIYCMIPVCIYGWYLSTRRVSDEVTDTGSWMYLIKVNVFFIPLHKVIEYIKFRYLIKLQLNGGIPLISRINWVVHPIICPVSAIPFSLNNIIIHFIDFDSLLSIGTWRPLPHTKCSSIVFVLLINLKGFVWECEFGIYLFE